MSEIKTQNAPVSYRTLKLSKDGLQFCNEVLSPSDEPQLVVKPILTGICRSDLKEFLGTRTIRHDFGHEVLGKVVAKNDARLPQVGDLVILDPHIKIRRSSGFGELINAEASIESLTKAFIVVPSSAPKEKLIFVEPLSCAHHCVANLLKFEKKDRLDGLSVAVVGAGMTGALIALLCRHYGADVTIVNRSQPRLDFLSSTLVFDKKALSLSDKVNHKFDVVIPTTTFLFPDVLNLCQKLVNKDGLVLLYGGTKVGDAFPDFDIDIDDIRRNQKLSKVTGPTQFRIGGTHGATSEDFQHVLVLLTSYPSDFPVEKLISRRIRLDDVPKVIGDMVHQEFPGKTIVVADQTLSRTGES